MIRTESSRINETLQADSRGLQLEMLFGYRRFSSFPNENVLHRNIQMSLSNALLYEDKEVLVLNKQSVWQFTAVLAYPPV